MKELNKFRKFLTEGADASYYAMTKAKRLAKKDGHDFDKLPKFARGKGVAHQQKYLDMAKEDVSENALGVDKGDGTFEITPDIQIMGQKFNFSDICPSAHKLVQNQAIVHQGFSRTAPTVLMFAILHRDFFALEKKALGPQGITADEYNDDVTRLYTEILNVAEKLGVRKQAKEYMDMHMAKIKDNGFKASEPGGSSDRNFGSDEEEYAQDWRDEQDDLFGKIREVRSRIASEVEGYTDLHKNDVVLEAFLGESNAERNPLRGIKNMFQAIIPLKLDTSTLDSLDYAEAIGIEGDWNAIQFFTEHPDKYEKYKDLLSQANRFGVDINPSTNVLDAYNAVAAAAEEYDLRENLEEGPYSSKTGYQVQYRTMNNKVASWDSKVFADKKEAMDFAKSKEPDPSIMGVQVWEFYGPGEKKASGTQYLGGEKQIYYYSNPVIRKKDLELSDEEIDIKNFMGSPSFTHKRYGLSTDYKLMDKIDQFKKEKKEFLASLD